MYIFYYTKCVSKYYKLFSSFRESSTTIYIEYFGNYNHHCLLSQSQVQQTRFASFLSGFVVLVLLFQKLEE